jgi:EmrB/QacA subfamily drug resistance transporter
VATTATKSPAEAGDAAADSPGRMGHGHPWLTLLSLSLGLVMVGLDGTVVSIANPTIGQDLHASLSGLQWVTNGYLLAIASLLVAGGKLGDMFGRKKVFLAGIAVFTLASLGCGLSHSIGVLILFRVLQGVGAALMMPQTLAILRNTFPAEQLQMAVGIWAGASMLSTAAGPIFGGLLVEHVNWQSIFYINLFVGMIAALVGWWFIRESRDPGETRLDVPGMLLLSGSLFVLVWTIIKTGEHGWLSAYTLLLLGLSAGLLAAWIWWMRRAPEPLIPLDLFRSRSLDAGLYIMLAIAFALFGVIFFVTLYLQRVQGLTPVQAGVKMLPLTGVIALSSVIGGVLGGKVPLRLQLTTGLLLVTGGLVGMGGLEPSGSTWGPLWVWFVLIGLGMGQVFTTTAEVIVGSVVKERAGAASGLQQTFLQVGGALGTSVLGAILTAGIGATILGKLAAAGVTGRLAEQVAAGKSAIAQGVVPVPPGTSAAVAVKITAASQAALTESMHTAFLVAAGVSLSAAIVAALFVHVKGGSSSAVLMA